MFEIVVVILITVGFCFVIQSTRRCADALEEILKEIRAERRK